LYLVLDIYHEPISGDIRGPAGYKQFVTVYRTGAPDIHFTIEDQVAEEDKVVTRYTTDGISDSYSPLFSLSGI
jgi:predicted ester cyclase